jgi:mono/diheme cytochrome c family protein
MGAKFVGTFAAWADRIVLAASATACGGCGTAGTSRLTLAIVAMVLCSFVATSPGADTNGFAVKFTSADGKVSDVMVLPNLWLYVENGKSATPFLPAGKFTAVFEGSINGDLRSEYFFKTEELSGTLKLEVNKIVTLDTSEPGTLSKKIQINKGTNTVRATFTPPAKGDSWMRVGWTEKGTNVNPIPNSWITHASTAELQKAEVLYLGRELFLEYRCIQCHTDRAAHASELTMDAPTFDGIGARRNFAWLAKWILDPKATRSSVHMPKLLHGPKAKEHAEAIAAFLVTLKTETSVPPGSMPTPFGYNPKAIAEINQRSGVNAKTVAGDGTEQPADQNQERKPTFERLHCTGCHNAPDKNENDPTKISLKHVAQKFNEGKLAEFLKAPEKHFAWIRMPNFKLSDPEAKELGDFLLKHADKVDASVAPTNQITIERGQRLVQSASCLNCHMATKLENKFATLSLAKVAKEAKGCLAERRDAESKAPDFGLTMPERDALASFLKSDLASLERHSPIEFAARETRFLNCNACHGQIDLVPPLEILGGKLKPEWATAFIAGEPFKIRADKHPKGELWIEARMPAFKSRAQRLAEGIAMQQGYAPKTAAEGPIDEEAAKIGHKMLGKDNGLSCISCHAVNDLPALEVFESEGPNLGLSSARLLKPYFFRWLRNPLAIDPQTKMPAYFEDGKSALTDYYDGDAERQINALYHYTRQGEKMAAPATGQ